MNTNLVEADPQKCNGCGVCRIVCAIRHDGRSHPARARLRILRHGNAGCYLPVVCRQCENAPCAAVCPREALVRDPAGIGLEIDYTRCISCRMCQRACPFGAIGFDAAQGRVFKCDACDGDPECVRFCYPGALRFVPAGRMHNRRARHTASNMVQAGRKQHGLFSGK